MKQTKSFTLEDDIVMYIEKLKDKTGMSSRSALIERIIVSVMLTGKYELEERNKPVLKEVCIEKIEDEKEEEIITKEEEDPIETSRKTIIRKDMKPDVMSKINKIRNDTAAK